MIDVQQSFGLGVESTLGFADAPSLELRDRITTALRYTFSWAQAVGSGNAIDEATGATDPTAVLVFKSQIADMQTALRALLVMIPADGVFPGNDAKAAYERVSAGFAQLYRDLALSRESLPRPDLLEQLGGLGQAMLDAPVAAVTTLAESISNALAKALGGTAGAIWSALWPWLLVAGAAGAVWVFRAPLGRALGKVAS